MAEVLTPSAQSKLQNSDQPLAAARPASLSRSLSFKYYIHDSVPTLRFQLIGDLQSANLLELNGSWETARTTLNSRRFQLDVRQLFSVDAEGRAWLLKMKDAGAQFLPADYLDPSNPTSTWIPEQADNIKLSILGRVMGLFRG